MRVCLVTETYPPEVNGVAMTLQRLCRGLARRGHSVLVVRPRQGRADQGRAEEGLREVVTPGYPLPGYPGLHFGLPVWRRLGRLWREFRPEVVHIATEGPLGWCALWKARRLGLAAGSSFHTNFHSYGQHYGFGLAKNIALGWLRAFHNRAAYTLAPSLDMLEILTADGFQRLGLLGRGVDTQLFTPTRREAGLRSQWGAGPDTPVAIYVGRLAGEKNIPLTVRACLAMREILPDLKVVLVGDGPLRSSLAAAHPEFHFAGLRRGEDLARHYACGDVFPFASTTETFGNVVTEAMASGLVVLAYGYAAARQYIRPGENGSSVPLGNEPAFLEAARALARQRAQWPAWQQAARATAEGLSWDAVITVWESRLQEIAAQRPPPW